jgi:hypothetical protein
MTLDDAGRVVTMIFQGASTVAIVTAAIKYLRRNERSGETLLLLEARFQVLQEEWQLDGAGPWLPSITRAVDREAHEFEKCGLRDAIEKGFSGDWHSRSRAERAWMQRLDQLFRFLMVSAAMEQNRLVKSRALWDTYHYWFRMVATNPMLRKYARLYFPMLDDFLRRNQRTVDRYERIASAATSSVLS